MTIGTAPMSRVSAPGALEMTARPLSEASAARYADKGLLGQGGMGEVRLVRDERIGRDVALKVIRGMASEAVVERFVREARVQAQLEHPAVVPVYDLGVTPDGHSFFTMKRVRGRSLETLIEVDDQPIGKNPRSTPATYVGVWDDMRDRFAVHPESKVRGYSKSRFSFNVAGGRCEHCQGAGLVTLEMSFLPEAYVACSVCNGNGLDKATRRLQLEIPPGIEAGSVRTVDSAGNRLRPDKPAGDLEIVIEVQAHPFFRRVGDDVVCKVPISFSQAALGGEVEVPSLEGMVRLRVPPCTQVGSVLRMKGKGIAHRVRAGNGDQLVEVTVFVPNNLSERARQLLEELGHELGDNVQPQEQSFMEKLKGLFG